MFCRRFRAHSIKPETAVTYNLQGVEVERRSNFQSELVKKYGKGPFLLGWHEIRQIIFDSLPPGVVEFNTQVSAVLPMCLLALGADNSDIQMGQVCGGRRGGDGGAGGGGCFNSQGSVVLPMCILALAVLIAFQAIMCHLTEENCRWGRGGSILRGRGGVQGGRTADGSFPVVHKFTVC